MAWNKSENKSIAPQQEKVISPGAPVVYYPGATTQPYRDSWDIERATEEGFRKVTWVFRCIDAIAGNQARLPVVLRKQNDPRGPIVTTNKDLLKVLNSRANIGENSFEFRYRLSSQLLLGTRGVFIEVIRQRGGQVDALHLLPPGSTSPMPDVKNFVSSYEVELPDGTKKYLNPDSVIWIRRPHPLDPYLSLTPLEAAGMAVEIENLARVYNRNFLMNDGRGGSMLILNGDIGEDDRRELMSRHSGGPTKAGSFSVIAAEGGGDFHDLGSNPRDAAYIEMRAITKEEILAAFGVPLSILGDASGRCLRRDELVRLSSGERVPAIKLIGENFRLLTATPSGHVEVEAWATLENHETIYRTTTSSGRTLETNGKHPLYAARYVKTKDMGWRSGNGPGLLEQGWTSVKDLTIDHVVAVPSLIEAAGHNLSEDEAFVLGALVGDGTMTGNGKPVGLSVPEGEFSSSFASAVERLGDKVVLDRYGDKVDFWRVRSNPENRKGSGRGAVQSVRIRELLRRVGLMGTTSHTKFVPEEVFMSSQKAVSAFISGYFAADGHVHVKKTTNPKGPRRTTISASTVSKQLAKDVQELLLRIGVNSHIRTKAGKSGLPSLGNRVSTCFEVSFSTAEDIINFIDHVNLPGKDLSIARSNAELALTPKLHGGNVHKWRTKDLPPNLRWERIASVEKLEEDDTVGIAVPGHHTYLSTFWEHNTFSNAAEEGRVFWMETMEPHLEMIARGLDLLDEKLYVGFDTSTVPILILAEQERHQYHMTEFSSGLTSANEYRLATGKKKVDSELADSLMVDPNLTAIGNTEKPTAPLPPQGIPGQPDLTGAPLDVQSGETPIMEFPDDAPTDGTGGQQLFDDPNLPNLGLDDKEEETRQGFLTMAELQTKGLSDDFLTKVEQDTDRWETILGSTLDRFFERQQRVVNEKTSGKKAQAALAAGTLATASIFNKKTWNEQLKDDLRPVVQGIVQDSMNQVSEDLDVKKEDIQEYIDAQMTQATKINDSIEKDLTEALIVSNQEGGDPATKSAILASVLGAIFIKTRKGRRDQMVEEETLTSYNAGLYFGSKQAGISEKVWLTRDDASVREAHLLLHGKSVPIGEGFKVQGFVLRFPKDPLAPAHLTVNCRCVLGFDRGS